MSLYPTMRDHIAAADRQLAALREENELLRAMLAARPGTPDEPSPYDDKPTTRCECGSIAITRTGCSASTEEHAISWGPWVCSRCKRARYASDQPTEPPPTAGGDLGAAKEKRADVLLAEHGPGDPGYKWFWRTVLRFCDDDKVQIATECRCNEADLEWRSVHHVLLSTAAVAVAAAAVARSAPGDAGRGRTAEEERADVVAWLHEVHERIRGHRERGLPEISADHTAGMVAGCISAAAAIERGDHIGAGAPRKEQG